MFNVQVYEKIGRTICNEFYRDKRATAVSAPEVADWIERAMRERPEWAALLIGAYKPYSPFKLYRPRHGKFTDRRSALLGPKIYHNEPSIDGTLGIRKGELGLYQFIGRLAVDWMAEKSFR